jgi:hypothetical protein
VSPVVSARTSVNASHFAIVVLVDMQQGYVAEPRLFDALHRNHQVTYPCDASASHALDDMPTHETHRAVCSISGLQGEIYETADWIASTLPRKLGFGKNAGG